MGRFDVGDDQCSSAEPGEATVCPLPNVTEHAQPEGVNWTMRSSLELGMRCDWTLVSDTLTVGSTRCI
jgi:hypothetical protein